MEVLVRLTIDGREVVVRGGSTVLEAAEKLGIEIPTFCHYAKLVDIGACRMCLVEVEKMRGLQTACTTKVQDGMVVHTNTPEVVATRKGVLEFLLTNHPLDCPMCDAGGECELQDKVFQFGPAVSRYSEDKRKKRKALRISPFIIMDEERCVLCRRCHRFLEEWAGDAQLDLFERGRLTYVGTFPGQQVSSPFSGNVIEICPVGALTSISFRFKARCWELKAVPGICTLCGTGCNLMAHSKANRLLRVVGRENLEVNDQWLCDRGRFGHDYVGSAERLTTPMLRRNGQLEPASWDEALSFAARRIQEIATAANPDVVAAIGSARASNETNYLLQKWARSVVGTNNVDFAGRPGSGATPLPSPTAPLDAGIVVLVGVDPVGDAPMVELFIRRAALTKGTQVIAIGPKRPSASRYGVWLGCEPGTEPAVLAGLLHLLARAKGLEDLKRTELPQWTEEYAPQQIREISGVGVEALKQAAAWLAESRNPLVLYGDGASQEATLPLVKNLLAILGGKAAYLSPYPNAWGALLMGVAPGQYPGRVPVEDVKVRDSLSKRWGARLSPRPGLSLGDMLAAAREGKVQAMFVVESDLLSEYPDARASLETLRFLVVQDHFLTPTAAMADVVLPSAAAPECDGSFVNVAGRLQLSRAAVYPPNDVRAGWQVIAELAAAMTEENERRPGKAGLWEYVSAANVWHEVTRCAPVCRECEYDTMGLSGWQIEDRAERQKLAKFALELPLGKADYPLTLVAGRAVFHKGALLGHSDAIAPQSPENPLLIHPRDAEARGIKTGDVVAVTSPHGSLSAKATVTEDVVPGCLWCATDVTDTPLSAVLEPPGRVTRVKLARG